MNRITIFVLLVTVSAGIIFFQNQLSEYGGQKIREDRITIVPKDERIKAGCLGLRPPFLIYSGLRRYFILEATIQPIKTIPG